MINKIEEFKNRLNKALSIRNISPAELSRKTKISESTISQYRSGYAKPKETKLSVISQALNVNPAWLMGLDVPMDPPTKQIRSDDLTKEEQKLIETYRTDPNFKEMIDRLALYALGIKKEGD